MIKKHILFFLSCFCGIIFNLAFGQTTNVTKTIVAEQFKNAQQLYDDDHLDSTIVVLKKLISEINKQPWAKDTLTANIYHQLGKVYYTQQKDTEALEAFNVALALRKDLLPATAPELASSYGIIGLIYRYANQYDKAIENLNEAIVIHKANDDPSIADSYLYLALVYRSRGDYVNAANYYKLSIDIQEKNPAYAENLAFCHNSLGIAYRRLENHEKARVHFLKALALEDKKSKQAANIYHNIGNTYLQREQYDKALDYFNQSLKLNIGFDKKEQIFNDYSNIGIAYKRLGQYKKSLDVFEKAEGLITNFELNDQLDYEAIVKNNEADVYAQQGEFDKALSYYQEAIIALSPEFNAKDVKQNPSQEQLAIAFNKSDLLSQLTDKANCLVQYFEQSKDKTLLEDALTIYRLADFLIDQMRFGHTEENSKLFWRKKTRPVYEAALDACYQLGDAKTAFYFFEKSKAVLLLDQLQNNTAFQFASIPDNLLQKDQALKKEIAANEQALLSALRQNKEELTSIREQLLSSKNKHQQFTKSLEQDYPKYYQLKYTIELAEIVDVQQKLLTNDAAFIEYFVGKKMVYILKLEKDQITFKKIDGKNLNEEVHHLLRLLKQRNVNFDDYCLKAYELYKRLLEPIAPLSSRLIFSNDAYLNYLPIEVLISKAGENANPKTQAYLLKEHTVSYAYSATVLQQSNMSVNNETTRFFGLAPERFQHEYLAPLKRSQEQIQKINALLLGTTVIGEDASKIRFLEEAPLHSIIHLSTHAVANATSAIPPYIYFYNDSISLPELYSLQLDADLVVLSACETASGKLNAGEGVMSIARGFAFAGIPSTITTLWQVDEQATNDITYAFYEQLKKGLPKDEALATAKRNYVANMDIVNASPYYWAALIQIGNSDAIAFDEPFNWSFFGFGILIFLGLSFLFFKIRT